MDHVIRLDHDDLSVTNLCRILGKMRILPSIEFLHLRRCIIGYRLGHCKVFSVCVIWRVAMNTHM